MNEDAQVILDAIGPDQRFAVPERIIRPYIGLFPHTGIVPKRQWVKVDPYVLDAYVFERCAPDGFRAGFIAETFGAFGAKLFSVRETCRAGNRRIPLFCGDQGDVVLIPRKADNRTLAGHHPYPRILEAVRRLSRLSGGLNISLHEENRGAGPHPKPDEDGVINIYPWMHPPGESGDDYRSRLFKKFISKDGQGILTYDGVPGRGTFVSDGKHDAVQCIGSNWYLLFSVVEFYNIHTTEDIFVRAMAATLHAWQKMARQPGKRRVERTMTKKAFLETAVDWANWQAASIDAELRKQEEKMKQLRRELAQLERQHFDLAGIRRDIQERDVLKKLIESFPAQWRRIRANERVESVRLVKDGIHVRTQSINIEHDGRTYPLGRFVIRISKDGVLTVWNEDRLHPDGVPHPHIDGEGTPCMGNATSAVDRAAAEHRYADAVEFTIRWLAEGYEEKLALHRIGEWPYDEHREDGSTVTCFDLSAYDVGEVSMTEEVPS